ncbi:hypothetical protein [Bacillus thuringiensis]|uniref:hypothetical protein n=1 Tax=Bacillus thuringiensis TaxID=1428 RepID=UPI000BF49404|nr:hypothetical protein [Bacillus thuringiensis]PFC28575.1 hypothetical protein CN299_20100 [Bacillus thuringiensis]
MGKDFINASQLYKDWVKGIVEVSELSQKDFNSLMIERHEFYKSHGGTDTFEEFMKFTEITGL